MKKKNIITLLIISTVCSLVYSVLLFLPYFLDVNKLTQSVNHIVYGYQIGFGVKGLSDVNIIGSGFTLICQLFGMAAFIFSLVFLLYFVVSKKRIPIMFFFFGLTIPGMALAATSLMVSWPLYQRLNATKNDIAIYTWVYFVSVVVTIVSFLINCFLLVYLATSTRKKDKKFIS